MSGAAPNSVIEITRSELDAIIDAAAERGAIKALKSLGLDDDKAPHDIRDIRQLITAWRDMKSEALKTAAKMVTTAILTAIVIGLGVQMGVTKLFGSP
ncbi:hypothetical protein CC53_gp044 [Rhizobium phage vB_RleS_L338C]|uniref:hypothetical protein n=1 Tax=Rhizobium phage vB_RleS_L338C TaxID=1414737 RepID=UPI0003D80A38|nr:hypothetical protein CC53_gp044 [Rhizobium phage vB_RleS_L338C]AHC30461.1 hypothetical protein L338C_044 [Rhizobium phage vB_RleS_L338C]QNH72149.1 hypothetical protein P11VFA_099 [Rhizobium phage P11VFA]